MEFSREEFEDILNIFGEESDEIVNRLNNNLLMLEKEPDNKDIITELFRGAHSLKGAARMIGFNDIQAMAHKIEDILGLAKEEKIIIKANITDVLCKVTDFINLNIQMSVKAGKEVKLDDYPLYMQQLDELISELSDKKTVQAAANNKTKKNASDFGENEQFFNCLDEQIDNLNAKIAEVKFLLQNINFEQKAEYFEVLTDDISDIKNVFDLSNNNQIKQKLNLIFDKLNNINVENTDKFENFLTDFKQEFASCATEITEILKNFGFEVTAYDDITENNAENFELKTGNNNKNETLNNAVSELTEKILSIINKPENLDAAIKSVKNFIEFSEEETLKSIFGKIANILDIIKNQNIRLDSELLNIIKQNMQLVEKVACDIDGAEKQDIDLLLQSLDITRQIISLRRDENLLQVSSGNIKNEFNNENVIQDSGQEVFKIFESNVIRTLRVDTHKLDRLVNQIGEVIISKIKMQKHIFELENINNKLLDMYSFSAKMHNYLRYYDKKISQIEKDRDISAISNFNKQTLSYLEGNQVKLNDRIQEVYKLNKRMQEDDMKLTQVVNQLEQTVKDIRLLPLATVFYMIPRMVRDIANEKGKEVELVITGSETNVDKKIIEEIKIPLIHIIRNAVDHGIESPQERLSSGKNTIGKINLSAKHKENKIIIEIFDDGRGVDIEKIRKKAAEKQLLTTEELNFMTDEQVMNLIFWPGFSTEEIVTDISGRGIGLDIVQTKITRLNGKVKVQSVLGQGTKVIIELPVTMATIKTFVIKLNSQFFAVPVTAIKAVIKVNACDIYTKDGKDNILYQNTSVPVFNLSTILGFKAEAENSDKKTILLIESENNIIGFVVDDLVGAQEVLHKEPAPPLYKLKNISGITTLINGESCLIINVSELLKNVLELDYKEFHQSMASVFNNTAAYLPSAHKVLVVDDFKTTRVMLKNILAAQGYSVNIANDAAEALEIIEHEDYDVIISDIEMPKINGYEFARIVKSSKLKSKIPIVLISSLAQEEPHDNPETPYVDLFLDKNNFNQEDFLSAIERLIKSGKRDN